MLWSYSLFPLVLSSLACTHLWSLFPVAFMTLNSWNLTWLMRFFLWPDWVKCFPEQTLSLITCIARLTKSEVAISFTCLKYISCFSPVHGVLVLAYRFLWMTGRLSLLQKAWLWLPFGYIGELSRTHKNSPIISWIEYPLWCSSVLQVSRSAAPLECPCIQEVGLWIIAESPGTITLVDSRNPGI